MDILSHNRDAWDRYVEQGNPWTVPVRPEEIANARRGEWRIYLTESKPVPRTWFPDSLRGVDVLCLASGGGQQGPILAAAGAKITVFDNSPKQLQRDRQVAEREGLTIDTMLGDMQDLSAFPDECFDLIIHPVSNLFVSDVHLVWAEAYRVLRPGGYLLSGFLNPVEYIFDPKFADRGEFVVKHSLPYSDIDSITEEERCDRFGKDEAIEFSHTLDDQIGGQLDAGFVLVGFYESRRENEPIARIMPSYIATRALKPELLA